MGPGGGGAVCFYIFFSKNALLPKHQKAESYKYPHCCQGQGTSTRHALGHSTIRPVHLPTDVHGDAAVLKLDQYEERNKKSTGPSGSYRNCGSRGSLG